MSQTPVTADVNAVYDPDGPALIAEIRVGFAAIAMVYELQLFRPDGLVYFPFASGTSRDLLVDRHLVPGDRRKLHRHMVLGAATVGPLSDGDPYRVELHVYQGTERIGVDVQEGEADSISVRVEPVIRLLNKNATS